MQELAIANSRQQEIKAPSKIWSMKNKSVNSLAVYKDWIYSASSMVEASHIKVTNATCWCGVNTSSIDTLTDAGMEKKQEAPNINDARKGIQCVGDGSSGGLHIFNLQRINEQHPGTGNIFPRYWDLSLIILESHISKRKRETIST